MNTRPKLTKTVRPPLPFLHDTIVGRFSWRVLIELACLFQARLKAGEVFGMAELLFRFLWPKEVCDWNEYHGVEGQHKIHKLGAIFVVFKFHSHLRIL